MCTHFKGNPMTAPQLRRANYGLDAPKVVRNLVLGAIAGLLLWGSASLGLWSGQVLIPLGAEGLRIGVADSGRFFAIVLPLTALWMVWESKVGKLRNREKMLQRLTWTGKEQVLDLGCGRGLLMIGAARRLTTGTATGIDIWQTEDLSGNRPEATLDNARCEGVEARVDIQTADMRALPFADGSFDVVVSRAAIHNLYDAGDRAKAIGEVARVLRPGGHALIEDIRHGGEYEASFMRNGCTHVERIGSRIEALLTTIITFGSLRPATLLVRKAG
ncbi:class I SAM-dependent methyltransferase [Massilia sp. CCM 8693]|uniref:Class I SAM-dependent methyltransferase n=2 Tax=Massilia aquatica TaxID=2609000 RepID=A0ABX0M197_9BURK|nr:class I SAM-dependent methyltransferase [Massilia aquatica]